MQRYGAKYHDGKISLFVYIPLPEDSFGRTAVRCIRPSPGNSTGL